MVYAANGQQLTLKFKHDFVGCTLTYSIGETEIPGNHRKSSNRKYIATCESWIKCKMILHSYTSSCTRNLLCISCSCKSVRFLLQK